MIFVLVRDDGMYVSKPGSMHSYTRDLRNARTFPTLEAAEADRCPGNERAVNVQNILEGNS